MAINALITMNLPESYDKERRVFYKFLEQKNWQKIKHPNSWIALFEIDLERELAINLLIKHMKEAKKRSRLKKVNFALQLGREEVKIESL